jgi:NADH:ubiquinone oxidoreductase subunit 3 (subunit A)
MRMLIAIGMLIIFISVFFVLLIGSSIINNAFQCTPIEGGYECTYRGIGHGEIIGFVMIFFFILVDVITVYMIVGTLSVSGKAI